jgi:hypothetical protein
MVRSEAAGEEALTKKVKGGKDVDGGSNDLPANVSSTSQGCCTIL